MDEDEYLRGVVSTWRTDFLALPSNANELCMAALGVAGEAGEVADYIKKVVFHGVPLDKAVLEKEMGDLRYYYTILAELVGTGDEIIKTKNHQKLAARYPKGFVQGGGIR